MLARFAILHSMKQKKWLIPTVVVALIIIASIFFIKTRPQTATSYEDATGAIYECSQPVRVKDQGAKYLSGQPSLTPIDQTEAAKYCKYVGIE
jgi:hypothetical protein